MNDLQLELTRLIGKKELSFGCLVRLQSTGGTKRLATVLENNTNYSKFLSKWWILSQNNANRRFKQSWEIIEIIWHPATSVDLYKWAKEKWFDCAKASEVFIIWDKPTPVWTEIKYCREKDLLDQEEETLKQIIELIKSYN